jgi:uncharacterized protein (DUF983 family)
MAEAKTALADCSTGTLRVLCPHCDRFNEFPDWSTMEVFVCDHCGESVIVEERVN